MLTWADLGERVMDLQQVYSNSSVEWLSLQVRITIEVLFPEALSIVMYEDEEERHIEDAEYQGSHPLNLTEDLKSKGISSSSAPLKSNTFRGIYLAVNIFDNEDDAKLESGSKNCKERRCIFDEVYFRMWSSNLWIARRRDLLEGSGFCPEEIMIVKFCSTDLERITSRKISCTRNPLILPSLYSSANFVDSGLDPLQFKSNPSPSSEVLDGSVFVLDPIAKPSIGPVTSKAELEFVKNIFCVISKLSDYLHPFFNFRIDFFRLVRNFQNRSQTIESILDVLRIISNPSQERVLFTGQR
nr:hypothetical protein Iba_chr04cCG17870 [Ipomoea batatas]